jgi:xanthine dehydrogenase large subunit
LLAFSVFLAIRDAIAATVPSAAVAPPLRAPATPEAILDAIAALESAAAAPVEKAIAADGSKATEEQRAAETSETSETGEAASGSTFGTA